VGRHRRDGPVAAVAALTELYFTTLAGRPLPLVRYVPALLLLSEANLTTTAPRWRWLCYWGWLWQSCLSGSPGSGVTGRRCWRRSPRCSCGLLPGRHGYRLLRAGGSHGAHRRRPTRISGIACLLLAVALPTAAPASARGWFTNADLRRVVVWWGLYGFYALGTAMVLRGAAGTRERAVAARNRGPRLPDLANGAGSGLATALPLLALGSVALSRTSQRPRPQSCRAGLPLFREDWPASSTPRGVSRPTISIRSPLPGQPGLYEMNRLGDDLFRFPKPPPCSGIAHRPGPAAHAPHHRPVPAPGAVDDASASAARPWSWASRPADLPF